MNGIRTEYAEPGGRKVTRNDWESILGRLDVLVDVINGALGRFTTMEEPRGDIRLPALQKLSSQEAL